MSVEPSATTERFRSRLRDYLQRGYRAGDEGGAAGRAIGFVMVIYPKLASSIAAIEQALRARLDRLACDGREIGAIDIGIDDLLDGGDDQDDLGDVGGLGEFFADKERMLRELLALAAAARCDNENLRLFLERVVDPLVTEGKSLLVFTEYGATQTYILEALRKRYPA